MRPRKEGHEYCESSLDRVILRELPVVETVKDPRHELTYQRDAMSVKAIFQPLHPCGDQWDSRGLLSVNGGLTSFRLHCAAADGDHLVWSCLSSSSGILNLAQPQSRHTESRGKTQIVGLTRPPRPGKWILTSAVNSRFIGEEHDGHDMIRPFPCIL